MAYFYLFLIVVFVTAQNILSKKYNSASHINVFLYNSVTAFSSMLFFLVASGGRLELSSAYLPYSLAFGTAYFCALAGLVLALKNGSLSLTSLIISYSLILPTLHGMVFLNERVGYSGWIGIAFLLVSLVLINFKKEDDAKFSFAWIVYLIIAFVGNGMCSVIQKIEQVALDGAYKSEFMIVALFISGIASLIIGLIAGKQRLRELLHTLPTGIPRGLANGAVNFLVMIVTGMLASSIVFPTISAGGIVLTFIIAVFVYRERLSRPQLVGYILGTASVVLLNL